MTTWVIDSSISLALVLPDERSAKAEMLLKQDKKTVFLVPFLWWYEVSNALVFAAKRKRLPAEMLPLLLDGMLRLPLHIDPLLDRSVAASIQKIASESSLTAYDAAYLELAQRHGARLATLDQQLAAAAASRRVKGL